MNNILLPMLFGATLLHIICRIYVYYFSIENEHVSRKIGHIVLYFI